MKKKYLWYSDTHFNFTLPWTRRSFVERVKDEKPDGLILTGDISCGLTIGNILSFLAKELEDFSIYFVLGNHDYYGTSFAETENIVSNLTEKHSNLVWLTKHNEIVVNDGVAFIGDEGWYDARLGNPSFLAYNLDWIMLSDFRDIKSFEEKKEYGKALADASTERLKAKLLHALEKNHTVYIITHMPPWAETCRGAGTELAEFWLPYNINSGLGQMIESIMQEHQNKTAVVLSGHTHVPAILHVAHNIECLVQGGKYLGSPTEHNCVFI